MRKALAPAALAACLLVLAGCPAGGEGAGERRVGFWTMQLKPQFTDYVEGIIAGFEKSHPGVKVDWMDVPAADIEAKTLTAAAAGRPPDLVNLNAAFANKLATVGALKPLDIAPGFEAGYFPGAWEACTFGGAIKALPWYLSTTVTFYNGALLAKGGVRPPLRGYADLLPRLAGFKAETGAELYVPAFGDRGKVMELLALEGVPLLSPDGAAPAFATPKGAAVLATWAKALRSGAIPQDALAMTHRESIDRFQGAQTALLAAGPQLLGIVKENAPKLYEGLTVGPALAGASGKVGMGVMNLAIPVTAKAPEEALALGQYVISAENQLAFCKLVPILPSARAALKDPFFRAGPEAPLEDRARAIAAAQLEHAVNLVPPMNHQSELAKSLDDAFQRVALQGQAPEAALAQAAAEWKTWLARP